MGAVTGIQEELQHELQPSPHSETIFGFAPKDAASLPKVQTRTVSWCHIIDNPLRVDTLGMDLLFLALLHLQEPMHCEQDERVRWWNG